MIFGKWLYLEETIDNVQKILRGAQICSNLIFKWLSTASVYLVYFIYTLASVYILSNKYIYAVSNPFVKSPKYLVSNTMANLLITHPQYNT